MPTEPQTIIHLHSRPPVQTQDMSTDMLHSILRAAESGQWEQYLALIRDITSGDAAILSDWMARKTRLLGKAWSLTAEVENDAAAAANVVWMTKQLKSCSGFLDARAHLLDSTLFPVAVVEKVYARTPDGYRIDKLVPVPHDLLDYRDGVLKIRVTTADGVPTGETVLPDAMRYIVHRGHLLRALPDSWGGPARALAFYWFLAAIGRSWWSRGLERDGGPFLLGKFDSARPEDRFAMEQAFADAVQRFGLVVSKDTDVQVFKDLASGTAVAHEAYQKHMLSMCSRVVVGQTLTSTAQAQGLGGGQAEVQNDVLTDVSAFDDMLLAETLQEQLFVGLLQLNRRPGPPPTISHGVISENMMSRAKVLGELKKAGIVLESAGAKPLSEAMGLPLRVETSAPVASLATLSARDGTAPLARLFRGSLAPVAKLVADSTSPEGLIESLNEFYATWSPRRLAPVIQEALTAFTAQAAAGFRV